MGRFAPRSEHGFTLVELLVAMTLGLMVLGAAVMTFSSALRSQPRATERGAGIEKARAMSERITRELRQGWSVPVATSNQLAIVTYVNRATCGGAHSTTVRACRVVYTCTAGTCLRTESNPDGSSPGAAATVLTGLLSSAVFTYSPSSSNPTFVGVSLSMDDGAGEDSITVNDGAALRNPVPEA